MNLTSLEERGEMSLPNENGIVCHIFSIFFLEGGGG
jgi:hypothetical protein